MTAGNINAVNARSQHALHLEHATFATGDMQTLMGVQIHAFW